MTPVTGIINDPEIIWRFAGELDVTIDAMDLVNSDHGDAIYRGDTLNPQIAGTAVDGEIDYLGRDGVWDIKTESWYTRLYGNAPFITDPSDDDGYKYPVSRRNLLQVILYYLIGLHCHDVGVFENMNYLGIYNARYDMGVKIDVDQLPQAMMHDLEVDTLGVKSDVAKF